MAHDGPGAARGRLHPGEGGFSYNLVSSKSVTKGGEKGKSFLRLLSGRCIENMVQRRKPDRMLGRRLFDVTCLVSPSLFQSGRPSCQTSGCHGIDSSLLDRSDTIRPSMSPCTGLDGKSILIEIESKMEKEFFVAARWKINPDRD